MENRIVIIDGNSLINRAYFAMQRPMITREGIYTQGIFGFLNMLSKINNDYNPSHIAVTFDRKAPTFRHLEYDEYKAGRKKMPPELAMQLPLLKEVLTAMNITYLEMDGWEADDLIGTIAKRAEENGLFPLIITGDKDELQLASDKTSVLITKKGISEFKIYDDRAMMEEYGLTPLQFIDLKGLMGDTSDNIPGVPGVGEKTALKLLHEYGSLENVLASTDSMPKNKLREKLEDNAQLAFMSKRLATINTNAPIEIDFSALEVAEPDINSLIDIYTKLEFNSFLKKLKVSEKNIKEEVALKELKRVIVKNTDELNGINGDITIKVLSDFSHTRKPEIYAVGIINNDTFYYVPGAFADKIAGILNDANVKVNGHDIKNDIYALMYRGLKDIEVSFDTAVASYVLDPAKSGYDFKSMAFEYLHMEIEDEKTVISDMGQVSLFDDGSEAYSDFLFRWCSMAMMLKNAISSKVKEEELEHVLYDIELPLVKVLASMEYIGVKADKDVLTEIGEEIRVSVDKLTSKIYELAGEVFNINSPMQLGNILFEKLGLPASKKTKKGYSTSADILENLKDRHEIIPLVLEYRTLTKLKGTYVDGLIPLIGSDGRIHAHFQQTVAATGRLSCTEPNLQNIPVRTELGRKIRKAFIAEDGSVLSGADYSQIELRVLAHMSGDEELIEAFNNGADIHKSTAAKVLGISEDEVTSQQRSSAKAVNFGVIYGMSVFGLSSELGITMKEAETYINDYFNRYRKVRNYMDDQIGLCNETGYVKTLEGRKRYIHEISASNRMTKQLGERLAMNSPIQGSAADIIKIAMIKVNDALNNSNLKSRLILQIHDELIIETFIDEIEQIASLLQENMETAVSLKVKLAAEVNRADNWYLLK